MHPALLLAVLLLIAAVVTFTAFVSSGFIGPAPSTVRVTVVKALGVQPQEGPPVYRYRVRLPDGSEGLYLTPAVHPPGRELVAVRSEVLFLGLNDAGQQNGQ